jgi:hypothetical protein
LARNRRVDKKFRNLEIFNFPGLRNQYFGQCLKSFGKYIFSGIGKYGNPTKMVEIYGGYHGN